MTDLTVLQDLAEAHYDEWDVMRHMLQFYDDLDDKKLDAIIDEMAAPIIAAIDCTRCANCCKLLPVEVRQEDAERLATALNLPFDEFVARYLGPHPDGDAWLFTPQPCPFLSGTLCSVYPHRPEGCRFYPGITPDFRWLLDDLIKSANVCPIVYNLLCAVAARSDDLVKNL
jgi:uncharacterized protein